MSWPSLYVKYQTTQTTWGLVWQKQVSRAGKINYIPQYLWDVIICPCPWYLLLACKSTYRVTDLFWNQVDVTLKEMVYWVHLLHYRNVISWIKIYQNVTNLSWVFWKKRDCIIVVLNCVTAPMLRWSSMPCPGALICYVWCSFNFEYCRRYIRKSSLFTWWLMVEVYGIVGVQCDIYLSCCPLASVVSCYNKIRFCNTNTTCHLISKCCRYEDTLSGIRGWFWERGREGFLGDRGHQRPYSQYKPCNHNLYIGIIIFPHIDNTQSTGHRKKWGTH